jgi:hypothetical protein
LIDFPATYLHRKKSDTFEFNFRHFARKKNNIAVERISILLSRDGQKSTKNN